VFFFAASDTTEIFKDFTFGEDTFQTDALGNDGFQEFNTLQQIVDAVNLLGSSFSFTDNGTDATLEMGSNGTVIFEDTTLS